MDDSLKTFKCSSCGKKWDAPVYGDQTLSKTCSECEKEEVEISLKNAKVIRQVFRRVVENNNPRINTFEKEEKALKNLNQVIESAEQ